MYQGRGVRRAHLGPARLALLLQLELLLREELAARLCVQALAVAAPKALGAPEAAPRLLRHLVQLLLLQGLLEGALLLVLLPHELRRLRLQELRLLGGRSRRGRLLALHQMLRLLRQQRPRGCTTPPCVACTPHKHSSAPVLLPYTALLQHLSYFITTVRGAEYECARMQHFLAHLHDLP